MFHAFYPVIANIKYIKFDLLPRKFSFSSFFSETLKLIIMITDKKHYLNFHTKRAAQEDVMVTCHYCYSFGRCCRGVGGVRGSGGFCCRGTSDTTLHYMDD